MTFTVKWASVVGTRPQFVKLGPVCRAIQAYNERNEGAKIQHCIIHTGQHYDHEVADLLFKQMQIPCPDHNLAVGSGSHGAQLAKMIERLEAALILENPSLVINYGDTNSTLAGALVAARLNVPSAHVEAGCRSGQISMPEEQTRIATDHLSSVLLAPSETAAQNLRSEGIGAKNDPRNRRVSIVGDLMYDALLQSLGLADQRAEATLGKLGLPSRQFYLLTLHRAENTNNIDCLRAILDAAESLDLPVVFPVHPRTKHAIERHGISLNGNLRKISPLGYLEMLGLEKHARKILTDSGGVQKEAFYLRVPCVTLRDNTEWPETVALGANSITGANSEKIRVAVLSNGHLSQYSNPYGDGRAADKIISELQNVSLC